jgi:GNAT superfamily N-acetyltransferase
MEIRDAQPHEQSTLSALHRRSSYVWEEDRVYLDAHPDALGVPFQAIVDRCVRVAAGPDGGIVGFSVLVPGPSEVFVLDDLFVEPALMRRGIGRALVEDAAERAASAGYREITVVAHSRNFAFYENVGFVRGEHKRTRFGPARLMRRSLTGRD